MNKPINNRETIMLEALGDLRKTLEFAEEMGNLEYIDGADPDLEIGALYEISLEEEQPPVLVFRNIKGYPPNYRMAVNVRSSKVFDNGETGLERVQVYRKHRRRKTDPIPPVVVESGPALENVLEASAVDVLAFPAPKWHEGDGGKYIGTECLVITRDPDSDWVNLGTYRVSVHDKTTLIVFIEHGKHGDVIRRKYWERGEPCPMIVTSGNRRCWAQSGRRRRDPACRSTMSPAAGSAARSRSSKAGTPAFRFRPTLSWCSRDSCRRPSRWRCRKARSASGLGTTLQARGPSRCCR